MKPTIMLDMDGVIADFITEYRKDTSRDSKEKFFRSVKERNIFTNLEKMPNADRLLKLLFHDLNVTVEILSSLGTANEEIAELGANQKLEWLAKNGVVCKANFVTSWSHKKRYASAHTIMIDDREDVIESFIAASGNGVVYNDNDWESMEVAIRDAVYKVKQHIDMTMMFSKYNLAVETT